MMTGFDKNTPTAIHVEKKSHLEISWADGHVSRYPIVYLQKMCPSASCAVTRGSDPSAGGGLLPILSEKAVTPAEITEVQLVGRYGIRFTYNNCNPCTGIFSFEYLRAVCPVEQPNAQPQPARHGLQLG